MECSPHRRPQATDRLGPFDSMSHGVHKWKKLGAPQGNIWDCYSDSTSTTGKGRAQGRSHEDMEPIVLRDEAVNGCVSKTKSKPKRQKEVRLVNQYGLVYQRLQLTLLINHRGQWSSILVGGHILATGALEQSQLTLTLQMIKGVMWRCLLELRRRRGSQGSVDHFGRDHMVSQQAEHHRLQVQQQNLRCIGNRGTWREEMKCCWGLLLRRCHLERPLDVHWWDVKYGWASSDGAIAACEQSLSS